MYHYDDVSANMAAEQAERTDKLKTRLTLGLLAAGAIYAGSMIFSKDDAKCEGLKHDVYGYGKAVKMVIDTAPGEERKAGCEGLEEVRSQALQAQDGIEEESCSGRILSQSSLDRASQAHLGEFSPCVK